MDRILIISPQSGFGNRIRVISSGILLAQKTGRIPYLLWPTTDIKPKLIQDFMNMNYRNWESYFEPSIKCADVNLECNYILSEWLPGKYWYQYQSSGQKLFLELNPKIPVLPLANNLELINGNIKSILIETTLKLGQNNIEISQIYQQYFRVKQKYIEYLNNLPNYNIGISVRGKDFKFFYPSSVCQTDKLILWILGLFTKIIKTTKTPKIIIFSDDHQYRDNIISILIDKFKINPLCFPKIIEPSFENWEIAYIEFLILSWKCEKIYGTHHSSFAEEAALFGGKFHYQPIPQLK